MQTFYINTGSVTYAHKAVSVLVKNGYKARIGRSLINSCGYGVYVEGEHREDIEKLLWENGVVIEGRKELS